MTCALCALVTTRGLVWGPGPADLFLFPPRRLDVPLSDKGGEMTADFFRGHPQGTGNCSGEGGAIFTDRICGIAPVVFQDFPADQFS